MGKLSVLYVIFICSLAYAQDVQFVRPIPKNPLECSWPTYKKNATELEKVVADMDSSMYCVNETTGAWLKEVNDELTKFLEGKDIIATFISRVKIIQDSYQYLKAACSIEQNSNPDFCSAFNERILDSDWIKIVYFHTVIMLNDVEFLKSWVSNMPIYDVNKMIHTKRLQNSKFRFTLAEKVAGAPYMKLEILKALGDLGLLDPHADESFPLTYAISNNQQDKLKYLIEYGYDPNESDAKPLDRYLTPHDLFIADDKQDYPPLIRAIGYENRAIFDYLMGLPSIDVNQAGSDGNSPLMIAAHHIAFGGSGYAFDRLLNDPRTDINHQNVGGKTILSWIGEFGAPSDVVKAITQDPRFKVENHCSTNDACLAGVIATGSLKKVKAYKPLFPVIDSSSKVYSWETPFDPKNKDAKREFYSGLTVFEYIDLLIEKEPSKAKELKKIKKYLLSQLTK